MFEVYKLTSPSGKHYIGMTRAGHKTRFSNHLSEAITRSAGTKIHNALAKYPNADLWQFEVLGDNLTQDEACAMEMHHIKELNTCVTGYNTASGGNIGNPGKRSAETRKKISDAKKGKDPWNKGKKGLQTHVQTDYQKSRARETMQKEWNIQYIDGTSEVIVGIQQWAKQNISVPYVTFDWQRRSGKDLTKYGIRSIIRL